MKQVATTAELLRLLRESAILDVDALGEAAALAAETSSGVLLARRLAARGLITTWQAGQLLLGHHQFRLGKYILKGLIGRGDFGRTYLAEHPQLRRDVAIKTLSRRFAQYPEIVQRFLADAREVAAFDHHNIVHVFDVDRQGNRFFVVMEHVEGLDLQQRVEQRGPEPITSAVDLLRQALAGLGFAHARGVLHQDLQPACLLLDDAGVVKITGFGVTRLAALQVGGETPAAGQAGPWCSPYLAPEQRRTAGGGDVRSDLYALGGTVRFLLTGQPPPLPGDRLEAIPWLPAAAAVPGAAATATREASALVSIVNRLREEDPAQRYASVPEVEQALQEAFPPAAGSGPYDLVSAAAAVADTEAEAAQPTAAAAQSATPAAAGSEDAARSDPVRLRRRLGLVAAVVVALVGVVSVAIWLTRSNPSGVVERPGRTHHVPRPRLIPRRQSSSGPTATVELPTVAEGDATVDGGTPAPAAAELTDPQAPTPAPAPDPAPPPDAPESGAKVPDESPAAPAEAAAAVTSDARPSDLPPPDAPVAGATVPDVTPPDAPPAVDPAPPAAPAPVEVNLPVAVDLPPREPPGAAAPAICELGGVVAPDDTPVTLTLLGGATAGPPGTTFQLLPPSDPAAPCWQVQCGSAAAGDPAPVTIAQVTLADQRLRFTWLDAAAQQDAASYLGNCALRVACGAQTHDLCLRRPDRCAPLRVNLKKAAATLRAKVAAVPDVAYLRFQVLPVEPPWPEHSAISPAEPVPVGSAAVHILLGDEVESDILSLELTAQCRSAFQLTCDATFRIEAGGEPRQCSARKLIEAEQWVNQNQTRTNALAQQLRAVLGALTADDPVRAAREADLRRTEQQLAVCTAMTQRMEWLSRTREQVAQGAPIHFRLLYVVDGCEVELLRSDATMDP